MFDEDWSALVLPISLERNFVVQGRPGPPVTLDMSFVQGKVRLRNGTALTFTNVLLINFRTGAFNQAIGFDLLVPMLRNEWGLLRLTASLYVLRACFPLSVLASVISNVPQRPPQLPGNNTYVWMVDQPRADCINDTAAPFLDRCYVYCSRYIDVALPGYDNIGGRPEPNGYAVQLIDHVVMCLTFMTLECIQQYGPLGCTLFTLNQLPPLSLPAVMAGAAPYKTPAEEAPSGVGSLLGDGSGGGVGNGTGSSNLAVVLGCVLGGVALLSVAVLAAIPATRRGCAAVLRNKLGTASSRGDVARGLEDGSGCSGPTEQCSQAADDDDNGGDYAKRPPPAAVDARRPSLASSSMILAGPPRGAIGDPTPNPLSQHPDALPTGGSGLCISLGPATAPTVVTPATPHRPDLRLDVTLTAGPPSTGSRAKSGLGRSGGGAAQSRSQVPLFDQLSSNALRSSREGEPVAGAGRCPRSAGACGDSATSGLSSSSETRSSGDASSSNVNVVTLLPTVLGKGAFGRVYEGEYQGMRVAVKVVGGLAFEGLMTGGAEYVQSSMYVTASSHPPQSDIAGQEKQDGEGGRMTGAQGALVDIDQQRANSRLLEQFAQEVEVLGRCHHPNVVRLLAACLTPPRLCLVMELMEMSLERLIFSCADSSGVGVGMILPLSKVLHIAVQICQGLEYLHPTIVHRDLKPANVLINGIDSQRPTAKITDFGLSRLRLATLPTLAPEAGTPAYQAPECYELANNVVTHHADMYSLGVLLWVMLTGQLPWKGLSIVAIAYKVTVLRERLPLNHISDRRCPAPLKQLIWQCWDQDPRRRPAAAEAVKLLADLLEQQQRIDTAHSTAAAYRRKSSRSQSLAPAILAGAVSGGPPGSQNLNVSGPAAPDSHLGTGMVLASTACGVAQSSLTTLGPADLLPASSSGSLVVGAAGGPDGCEQAGGSRFSGYLRHPLRHSASTMSEDTVQRKLAGVELEIE